MSQEDLDLSTPPDCAVVENRIGIVMYGGIPLAAFMCGVAEEFLRLVSATALDQHGNYAWVWNGSCPFAGPSDGNSVGDPEPELRGTEIVYRQMAHSIASSRRVFPKFIVDILTGTGVGGINATFLGKSLTQGLSLEPLSRFWINQVEFQGAPEKTKVDETPSSADQALTYPHLLRKERMYSALVDSLDEMDESSIFQDSTRCSLVQELDLHISATDLAGRPVPIHLGLRRTNESSIRYASELDHRASFNFRHSRPEDKSDFEFRNNPFLAFVGGLAFSVVQDHGPMRVKDAKAILEGTGKHLRLSKSEFDEFYPQFYKGYWRGAEFLSAEDQHSESIAEAKRRFQLRPFGFGGLLDSDPFGHSFKKLRQRRADTAVQRVVFYLDPTFQHIAEKLGSLEDLASANPHIVASQLLVKQMIQERACAMRSLFDQAARMTRGSTHAAMGRHLPPFMPYLGHLSTIDLEAYPLTLYLESTLDLLAEILSSFLGFGSETPLTPGLRTLILAGLSLVHNDGRDLSENPIAVVSVLEKFDHGYFTRAYESIRIRLESRILANDASPDEKHSAANAIWELNSSVLRDLHPEAEVPLGGFILSPESLFRRSSEAMDTLREGGDWRLGLSEEERAIVEAVRFLRIRVNDVLDIHRCRDDDVLPFDLALSLFKKAPQRQTGESSAPKDAGRQFESCSEALDVLFRSIASIMGLLPRWFALARFASEHDLMDELVQFPTADAATFPTLYGAGLPDSYALDLVRISPGDIRMLRSDTASGDTDFIREPIGQAGQFPGKVRGVLAIVGGRLEAARAILNTYAEPGDFDTLLLGAHMAIVTESLAELGRLGLGPKELELAKSEIRRFAMSVEDHAGVNR